MNVIYKSFLGFILSILCHHAFANPNCMRQFQDPEACMTIGGLVSHLKAFEAHANSNQEAPGTRFMGTHGYNLSRDYVMKKLTDAGYKVTVQTVPMAVNYVKPPRFLLKLSPSNKIYVDNIDFAPVANSGVGDVTGRVEMPSGDGFGCVSSDFQTFTPKNIALIQYGGPCGFRIKIQNAVTARASGIIVYNNTHGIYYAGINGFSPLSKTTPVVFASLAVGEELKKDIEQNNPPVIRIKLEEIKVITASHNILAESASGNANHVVMAGAHLDSSSGNAGMNDNGSAAAMLLEVALLMKDIKPVNQLRFAWWTGEEVGLLGSTYYMSQLSSQEKSKIALYLNYEILGAPNGGRLIMGAKDGVTPPGTKQITKLYSDYFKARNLKSYVFDPTMGSAAQRSDMFPFIQAGIPVGFLVTGADLPWNPLFNAIFTDLPNRKIGLATHPCYHKLCDKLTLTDGADGSLQDPNFDFDLYVQMSKAAAYAINTHAMN